MRFSRYELRTSDVAAAGEFYDAVLGRRGDGIVELPQEARARGAPPHWLGYLDVTAGGGVEAVAARFVERGAMRVGPPRSNIALLRDPGGAIVALADALREPSRADVAWHQLNTTNAATASVNYADLFGWTLGEHLELGTARSFAFAPGQPSAGAISGIEDRPAVHPHWLFFFAVPSLDAALAAVTARGGLTMRFSPALAVCEDPQGGAFGLHGAARIL